MIKERLKRLREKMANEGVDWCLIPTSDYHNSEYLSDYFKVRDYFSGFTGSAGTLVVGALDAYLYTDGRYFIQAAQQLEGSTIVLMKMAEPGVPKIPELLREKMKAGETLGFDGRLLDSGSGQEIKAILDAKGCKVNFGFDPAANIWSDRPKMIFNKAFILPETTTGESVLSKIERIRKAMDEVNADMHIMTSLDDIAWTLNLRGNDIENNPVFFGFLIVSKEEVILYSNIANIESEVSIYLLKNNIRTFEYEKFFTEGIESVNNCTQKGVLLDIGGTSFSIGESIKDGITVIDQINPAARMKAVKNKAEIENIKKANIKDGVSVVKFDRWLKEAVDNNEELSEMSVAKKLAYYREENDTYIEPSFDTISSFGHHGAIIHYEPTEETDIKIGRGSFLLIDSGGQYQEGTTDVTRTYQVGEIDQKLKHDYTLVLRANLKLLNFKFLKGIRGNHLDIIARDLFWSEGRDYKHGTGHGIGALLNVHEGPNNIRWNIPEGKQPGVIYEPGMITSDEPGIYIENEYGIRIETDMVCVEDETNEFGTFYRFEPLTYVPIDKRPIEKDFMTKQEIQWLDEYHKLVYEKLSPYLEGADLEYLRDATAPL